MSVFQAQNTFFDGFFQKYDGLRQIQILIHTHVVHLSHVHAVHHIVDKCSEFLGRLLDRGQASKDGDVVVTAVAVSEREAERIKRNDR